MGKDLKVPFPSGKNNPDKSVSRTKIKKSHKIGSLNFGKRKEEIERIKIENAKLFKKLVSTKGVMSMREEKSN